MGSLCSPFSWVFHKLKIARYGAFSVNCLPIRQRLCNTDRQVLGPWSSHSPQNTGHLEIYKQHIVNWISAVLNLVISFDLMTIFDRSRLIKFHAKQGLFLRTMSAVVMKCFRVFFFYLRVCPNIMSMCFSRKTEKTRDGKLDKRMAAFRSSVSSEKYFHGDVIRYVKHIFSVKKSTVTLR